MTKRALTLSTAVIALVARVAFCQPESQERSVLPCPISCDPGCQVNRDCNVPPDTRDCQRTLLIGIRFADPACEAAKAAQNSINANQKALCETNKAAQRYGCLQMCFSVARACGAVREKAELSRVEGARALWVDDHADANILEAMALNELGITVERVSNTREALARLDKSNDPSGKHGPPDFDVIISNFRRSDDAAAGYTLLGKVLKLPQRIPYIIYTGVAPPELVADAKKKGAFGETDQVPELFDLVIRAVKGHPSRKAAR